MNTQKILFACLLLMMAIQTGMAQPEQEQKTAEQLQTEELSTATAPLIVSLRTNLLYWAVATPNIGVEWKPSTDFGVLVNGAWSHWIWSEKNKHHRTWLVQPELRRYFGESKQWFIGIEGHVAEFNFKFNNTGYQGNAIGAGITGGYRLQLNKCLDMDFSLGLGYTNLKYDTYYRSNDVMVRKDSSLEKNIFGPTQAGVAIIFKL